MDTLAVKGGEMPVSGFASRIALSSIASKTGPRSPGEELMTCNTSAVAVCCSKASRVSVINRAFSIAITACAAKDRSPLQRLLADIAAGRIDTVVVYKIDRLTRSLADFAKIVEILDTRARPLFR